MDEQIARLEEKVDRLQDDTTDLKDDARRVDGKIDAVRDSVAALRIEMKDAVSAVNIGRFKDKVWWLLIAAALLSVMAHGFKWL